MQISKEKLLIIQEMINDIYIDLKKGILPEENSQNSIKENLYMWLDIAKKEGLSNSLEKPLNIMNL